MYKIKFRYMDDYSRGKWRYQECTMGSVQECIDWYGLNECEYEIISAEKVED